MPGAQLIETFLHVGQASRIRPILEVVLFGDLDDNVHHIREAATAEAALAHLMVDLGRHDELPGVFVEELTDDLLHVPGRDHIALADKHPQALAKLARANAIRHCGVIFGLIVSCRQGFKAPASSFAPGAPGINA
jgi:hypothetical protein